MSRSGSESRSPSKRHSRNREAAVAAIIDSLYGTTTPGPDSPDQATESTLPHLGTDAAAHAAELTTPTAPPHSEVDPTVESPTPPPPPPPPPSVSEDSANPRMPPPVATAKPPPPPPSSAQEEPAVAAADVPPPPPPPTPQAEPVVEPPAKVKVDYASSSAMVKDILSADRQQGSDENAPTDMGPKQDSVSIDRLPDAPVSSDFFTSAKQKKRRWRPR